MTTKDSPEQANNRGRAVWLGRLPAGRSHDDVDHRNQRYEATRLARSHGANIVGEFLVGAADDQDLPDQVRDEVFDEAGLELLLADGDALPCPISMSADERKVA